MPEMTKRKRHDMLKDAEVGTGTKITRFFLGPKLEKDNSVTEKLKC